MRAVRTNAEDNPRAELFDIGLARFGPNGRLFVSENARRDIRVFDSTGRFLNNIGRNGGGPGEFREVGYFGWVGDTLWVTDRVLKRITLFGRTNEVLRTLTADPKGVIGRAGMQGLTASGRFVQMINGDPSKLFPAPILRVSREGAVIDTLAIIPYGRTLARVPSSLSSRGRSLILMQPFTDQPIWDIDRTGRWLAIVNRDAPNSPSTTSRKIQLYDLQNGTSRTLEYPFTPVATRKSVLDSVFSLYSADLSDDALRSVLYLPSFLPPVRSVVVGDDGAVWLERIGDVVGAWIRLDPRSGAVSDVFQIPANYRVSDARGRELLAIIRVADDVLPPIAILSIIKQ